MRHIGNNISVFDHEYHSIRQVHRMRTSHLSRIGEFAALQTQGKHAGKVAHEFRTYKVNLIISLHIHKFTGSC